MFSNNKRTSILKKERKKDMEILAYIWEPTIEKIEEEKRNVESYVKRIYGKRDIKFFVDARVHGKLCDRKGLIELLSFVDENEEGGIILSKNYKKLTRGPKKIVEMFTYLFRKNFRCVNYMTDVAMAFEMSDTFILINNELNTNYLVRNRMYSNRF
ncbi:MAG: hypothetical protein ACI4F0_02465 [Agathobacter sp.]